MNFGLILLEIILGFILFLLMTYLKRKQIKALDTILIPSIYLIIIAALIPNLKDSTFGILISYFGFDILSLTFFNQKDLLMNEKNYYFNMALRLITGFLVYYFFLLKVDNAFLDMNIFKNFVWLLIILYLLSKLNLTSIKLKDAEVNNFEVRYQEYVIMSYAKFKNKYGYLLKTKNKDIENVLYSFLIYENYLHGSLYRALKDIKNKVKKSDSSYGIMNVKSDHFLTDEESIVLMKERLEMKVNRFKKSLSKEEVLKKLINEKYKETFNYKEIIKIINYIEDFNGTKEKGL